MKLYTVSLRFCSHFKCILPFSYYSEPHNTLRNVDRSLLCCLWHRSFTNSAMCSVGATMEQCCPCLVLCVLSERKVAIKLTSCWVRCCQAHTHSTLLSHPSAPYPPLSFFSFFSPVGRKPGKSESRMPLSKESSWFLLWFWVFYRCWYANMWLQGLSRDLELHFHKVRGK